MYFQKIIVLPVKRKFLCGIATFSSCTMKFALAEVFRKLNVAGITGDQLFQPFV